MLKKYDYDLPRWKDIIFVKNRFIYSRGLAVMTANSYKARFELGILAKHELYYIFIFFIFSCLFIVSLSFTYYELTLQMLQKLAFIKYYRQRYLLKNDKSKDD